MAPTLELFDGSTTINFADASGNYGPRRGSIRFGAPETRSILAGTMLRGVHYGPREISFPLWIKGSSVADLQTKIRDLHSMLAKAIRRQKFDQGTIVVLKTQLGDNDASDISFRILSGALDLSPSSLDTVDVDTNNRIRNALLTLLVEPFGRLAAVNLSQDTLENEQDSNANYIDVTSITGTHGAKLQFEVEEGGASAWTGSKKIWVAMRSGERRTDTLFIQGEAEDSFVEGTDPFDGTGGTFSTDGANAAHSSNTSGGQTAQARWTGNSGVGNTVAGYLNAGYVQYNIVAGSLPQGLFRVLVRGRIDSDVSAHAVGDVGFALGWAYGAQSYTPVDGDEVYPSAHGEYQTIDLGELALPPHNVPDGYTGETLNLRIYLVQDDTAANVNFNEKVDWFIDYLFLLPIDEGVVTVDAVGDTHKVLIDGLSDTPGVYLINDSDEVVQQFATATGGPFDIGPEDTRIYVLRDDTGDPTSVTFIVNGNYTPLVADL